MLKQNDRNDSSSEQKNVRLEHYLTAMRIVFIYIGSQMGANI